MWAAVVAYVGEGAGQGVVLVVDVAGGMSWCEQGRPMRVSLGDVAWKGQPSRLSLVWWVKVVVDVWWDEPLWNVPVYVVCSRIGRRCHTRCCH